MWYASSEKWATSAFTSSRAPGQVTEPSRSHGSLSKLNPTICSIL
ncbi:hypothetical protein V3C99_009290, partial [Haemonchus contortus]